MNVKIIWSNFLNSIKNEMTPLSFNTWFKDTELYEYKDGIAKIIVPMGMFKRHLATRYYDLIVNTLSEIIGDNVDIQFFLREELETENIENESNMLDFMGRNSEELFDITTGQFAEWTDYIDYMAQNMKKKFQIHSNYQTSKEEFLN